MKIFLYIAAALVGYFVAGFNPAIAMSRAIYHKDIRECGSGNPGFTNFKRTFGNRWAWWVLATDMCKAAIAVGLFAFLFEKYLGDYHLGAVYTGCFAMLGHAYPAMYRFKGGKGFLVCLSTMWVLDLRVGLIATLVMIILLLTTKYMSLSTVLAMCTCPLMLALFRASVPVVCLASAMVLFMMWRHRKNFARLLEGSESKFYLKGQKENM